MSLSDPSTWRFLAGSGGAGLYDHMPEDTAQHVMNLGANGVYIGCYIDGWGANVIQHNGLTQTVHKQRYVAEIRRLGGLVYLQQYPWSWEMDLNWDVQAQNQRECINDSPAGQQDEYIQWVKNVVGGCYNGGTWYDGIFPDICQIINEVTTQGLTMDFDIYMNNYVAFCNRFMAELNTINPNMTFTVSSIPFWDLLTIADHVNEFVIPSGCNLLFSMHNYYAYGNVEPLDYMRAFYNYWHGNLAAARTCLFSDLYNGYGAHYGGAGAILAQGKKVIWDEWGTNILNENWANFYQDAFDFCIQYGLGFCALNNTADNNHSPAAFWSNTDWTLNALGQAWQQLVGDGDGDGATLPFRDDFNTDLSKWTQQSGTWSVQ